MTYEEALQYIYSRRKFQKSNSHERIERLLELLSNPQQNLRFIHVAGTNGKGSVSTAISFVLRQAGYKTGLFTSPFIIKFDERIQVDGEFIPEREIASITQEIKEKLEIMESEELYPTVFEVTTALALVYFKRTGCDFVVLEAGIGGEHDSTNVIKNTLVSVFTHISVDHADMLGDTPEKIAKEKSGIIKKGCKVVSFPENGESLGFIPQKSSVMKVLKRKSDETECEFLTLDANTVDILKSDITGSEFIFEGNKYTTKLCGAHQIGNMLTAICAVKALRKQEVPIDSDALIKGISLASIPGRMETVSESPMIILDGGHNEGCMKALRAMLEKYLEGKNIIMLSAFMKDKDTKAALEIIAPVCRKMVFTCVDSLRGEDTAILKNLALPYCEEVFENKDPVSAFENIRADMGKNDVLVVAGSFYLVSEIRNKFFS